MSPASLRQRHRIGDLANALPAQRGVDRFDLAAKALMTTGLTGFGISNLRKMSKFAIKFSADEAHALDLRRVSWRDADRLRSKHIQSKLGRALTQRAVRSLRLTPPARLGHLITDVSEPEARENLRSTKTAASRAEVAIDFLAEVARRAGADGEIREDAFGRLRWIKTKVEVLIRKVNRSPNAPPPSIRRT